MEDEIDVTKLRYVLYARKSTVDETRQVRSIPDQITDCHKFIIDRLHLNIVETIKEEKSAQKPNQRPKFTQMLKDLKAGKYDGIVAWNPDRLCRNMKEGGEIIDMIDQNLPARPLILLLSKLTLIEQCQFCQNQIRGRRE